MAYSKKMIRVRALLSILLCVMAMRGRTQTVDQLLEQLALDIQKLSELRTILQDMYQGYEVVDKGYSGVRDIVRNNFNLHKAFLDGLLAVSPSVRQYYRVAAIIDMEGSLITESQNAEHTWIASGVFTSTELGYIHGLNAALFGRAGRYLDRLTMLVTADELRMSDAERIERIDDIYKEVAGDLEGLRRYNEEVSIQVVQRTKEMQHINLLKSMYGIQP